MPRHSHEYEKFRHEDYFIFYISARGGGGWTYPVNDPNHKDNTKFLYTYSTTSVGGGCSHNNMPPFLTANCWKRTG